MAGVWGPPLGQSVHPPPPSSDSCGDWVSQGSGCKQIHVHVDLPGYHGTGNWSGMGLNYHKVDHIMRVHPFLFVYAYIGPNSISSHAFDIDKVFVSAYVITGTGEACYAD